MLILPIQEQVRSFHFLVSSSISFFQTLKFLSNRSFTSLVKVTPRYFMLFVTIVKGDLSLISLSVSLFLVYRRATDFLELILYPATLLKVFISYRSSLVEFLGSLMYTIISSANNESLISSFPIRIPYIEEVWREWTALSCSWFQWNGFEFLSIQLDVSCRLAVNSFYYI